MDYSPELENERYSIWKRILIFIIEGLTSLLVFIGLLFTLGNFIQRNVAYDEVQTMNYHTSIVLEELNLPSKIENQYGLIEFDQDTFLDLKVEEGLSIESAVEEYNKQSEKVTEELVKIEEYTSSSGSFYAKYITIVISMMFIPLFIFQFLIPLLTKKHQTLTWMMFKVTLVDAKSNVILNSMKLLYRFILIYVMEFLFIYLLISWIGIIFLGLVTLVLISFTNNRLTVHDLVLKAKIRPVERSYNE